MGTLVDDDDLICKPVRKFGVGLLVVMTRLELCTLYGSFGCHQNLHHP